MTHRVRDVNRTLEFEGELLASSNSWKPGAHRWVEFFLYKTASGSYVISRVGISTLYHRTECAIVKRNKLKLSDAAGLGPNAQGCEICRPGAEGTICAEEPRYWAQVCADAQSVIEACWMYDEHGAHYYTLVARRLIEEASAVDKKIEAAYSVEYID